MVDSLIAGVSETRKFPVSKEKTIGFMGEGARVYATPSLVHDIEHTCRDLIAGLTEDGKDSVGFEVSVKHLAPTLLNMEVSITVTVAEVEGPKVVFDITAQDSMDLICKGSHTRFVVDVAQTEERLKAKAEKVAGLSKA